MEQKTILIRRDKNYGKWTAYPACKNAEIFAKIAGTRTLTLETRNLIEQLGYEIYDVKFITAVEDFSGESFQLVSKRKK